jgi:hypothetical protein
VSLMAGGSRDDSSAVIHLLIPCLAVPAAVGLLLLVVHIHRRCKSASVPVKSDVASRRPHPTSNPMGYYLSLTLEKTIGKLEKHCVLFDVITDNHLGIFATNDTTKTS